jgi:hypothetical protein
MRPIEAAHVDSTGAFRDADARRVEDAARSIGTK